MKRLSFIQEAQCGKPKRAVNSGIIVEGSKRIMFLLITFLLFFMVAVNDAKALFNCYDLGSEYYDYNNYIMTIDYKGCEVTFNYCVKFTSELDIIIGSIEGNCLELLQEDDIEDSCIAAVEHLHYDQIPNCNEGALVTKYYKSGCASKPYPVMITCLNRDDFNIVYKTISCGNELCGEITTVICWDTINGEYIFRYHHYPSTPTNIQCNGSTYFLLLDDFLEPEHTMYSCFDVNTLKNAKNNLKNMAAQQCQPNNPQHTFGECCVNYAVNNNYYALYLNMLRNDLRNKFSGASNCCYKEMSSYEINQLLDRLMQMLESNYPNGMVNCEGNCQ